MASVSIACYPEQQTGVRQGDIFCDVKYSFIENDEDEQIEVIEYTFPYAIVLSQSCDVLYMDQFEDSTAKPPLKFMPGILLCPIYDSDSARKAFHLSDVYEKRGYKLHPEQLYISEDKTFANRDLHVRFHALAVRDEKGKSIIDDSVIDFKHIFTVPMSYLKRISHNQRLCSLRPLYATQIANKLYSYLARVGLP